MKRTLLLAALAAGAASAQTEIIPSGTAPALAQDKNGTFWCAFVRQGNVLLMSSTDQGKTWGEQQIVADGKGKAPGARQRGPRLGISDGGVLFVTAPLCLDTAQLQERFPKTELCLMVSRDGKAFDKPIQVNEVKGAAAEALHASAVAADGAVHVVWLDDREGKGNAVWYARHAEGKFTRNVRVSNPACPCCAPAIAVDGRGNPVVVYREMKDDGSRQIFMTSSRDGGRTFAPPARLNKKDSNIPD